GAIKLTEENEVIRTGGIEYTVKDGIIFNCDELLEDVRKMVKEAKGEEDFEISQPGMEKPKS
ncbi:MAG: amidohydrolase, partial [Saprospiraceae bacterium]|nr:amidohydrolase [Saprospiraceae bacterium]